MPDAPFALYNPALLDPDTLLGEFTARLPLLDTLLKTIRSCKLGHPPQHCLLIGARGMGKTTTLWAVAHRIDRDAELRAGWQPVVFDEESRRVGDLADFWLEAIRHWEATVEAEPGLRAERLLDETPPDLEKRALDCFLGLLDRSGRRAVLLIDNFNELLASIREPEQLHRLRAFLMEDSRVLLIGGATSLFEEVTSIDQPFHDFFRLFPLKPLTLEEMRDCLRRLAELHEDREVERVLRERQGTVEAIHLLTGGNPRLVKTFYRLLSEGLRADIRSELERLLDEFTPYFKAIVDALPAQQQRIFDAIALAWNPVEVASVAKTTRLASNQVSAQIRALVKAGLIREAAGSPKRKTYLLADRFSNIHYLMRHGRAARNRLEWFVKTLLILFPDESSADVLARLAGEAAGCGDEGRRDARDLMRSAWASITNGEARRNLAHKVVERMWSEEDAAAFGEWLDSEHVRRELPEMEIVEFCRQMPTELRQRLGYQPEVSRWWFDLTDFLEENKAWALAEKSYRRAIELDPNDARPWTYLGYLQENHLGQYAEAEASYCQAIKVDPSNASYSWTCLGRLQQTHLGQYAEAEASYLQAIKLEPSDDYYWTCLGRLQHRHLGQYAEAEASFRQAIKLDSSDAYYWTCLGFLQETSLGQYAEAEASYREAIKLDPRDAYSWTCLGRLQENHLGQYAEAEASLRQAIKLNPKRAYPFSLLANVLSRSTSRLEEARQCATTALLLDPTYAFARGQFRRVCGDSPSRWTEVLPRLLSESTKQATNTSLFDFAVEGAIRLAHLSSPELVLPLVEASGGAVPFESLLDALRVMSSRDHLQSLAPERQTVALRLIERFTPKAAVPTPD